MCAAERVSDLLQVAVVEAVVVAVAVVGLPTAAAAAAIRSVHVYDALMHCRTCDALWRIVTAPLVVLGACCACMARAAGPTSKRASVVHICACIIT